MKKILLSVLTIGIVAVAAVYGTQAFFNDTEKSTGNVFQAGALDLKVSSECHYFQDGEDVRCGDYGDWEADDLTNQVFFHFTDLKPGDYGENTIDFYVDDNPAWMCANITIDSQDENGNTEPEGIDGEPGELGKYLELAWWKDDGDNIFESGETLLYGGPKTLEAWLAITGSNSLPLTFADSVHNWTGTAGPILGGVANTQYLGVAWCFGDMTLTPSGLVCDGSEDQNDAQTDGVVGTLSFEAVQHRNNPNFLCPEHRIN